MEDKIEQLIKESQELKQIIYELKEMQYEGTVLETSETLEDKDVIEIESTTKYAEGKPTITTMKYKYKDDNNQDIECKANNKKDKLKAIYKAEIFEYESGRIDILYECDKDNHKECSKESCTIYDYCRHTLNKKYAKNFINKEQT